MQHNTSHDIQNDVIANMSCLVTEEIVKILKQRLEPAEKENIHGLLIP